MKNEDTSNAVEGLKKLLADTYVLALKTQGFHWNVTGRSFPELHMMFEEQYTALYTAGDEIAERLRAKQVRAPASFASYARTTSVPEEDGPLTSRAMCAALAKDHELVGRVARDLVHIADREDDVVTADLATRAATFHEKTAWMLRSTVEEEVGDESRSQQRAPATAPTR